VPRWGVDASRVRSQKHGQHVRRDRTAFGQGSYQHGPGYRELVFVSRYTSESTMTAMSTLDAVADCVHTAQCAHQRVAAPDLWMTLKGVNNTTGDGFRAGYLGDLGAVASRDPCSWLLVCTDHHHRAGQASVALAAGL
jgi:hypothetical protein